MVNLKKLCLFSSFSGEYLIKDKTNKMIDKNEVKKDLYKSKNMAGFSHYVSGNLYYKVELADGIYQFPIATVEEVEDTYTDGIVEETNTKLQLSEDLGVVTFNAEINTIIKCSFRCFFHRN